jgi:putative tricarboxylic transport membrane protein
MGTGAAFLQGAAALAAPVAAGLLLLGTLAGTVVGSIPGLGGAILLTVLLPFLYRIPVGPAIALIVAAHASIYFSGSITAILFNSPGAPESAATTFDGYAMTRRGEAGRALGISAVATTLGGWLGSLGLLALIPVMGALVLLLHPPEYLMLSILAVVIVGQLRARSLTKGVLSGLVGFLFAFVGYDPVTGIQRFDFNLLSLYNGFNIAVVALGLFAISEMVRLFAAGSGDQRSGEATLRGQAAKVRQGMEDVFHNGWLALRSSVVGFLAGLVPGVGGVVGNFLSYSLARVGSRRREQFGTGIPEGVIAPESSSLAKEAASYVPLLALGVPGTVGTAVILSALTILGVSAGPLLVQRHLPLVFEIVAVLLVTSALASAVGLLLAPFLARVATLPGPVIAPFVIAVGFLGAWAATRDMIQVLALVLFAAIGFAFMRYGYSVAASVVGFVLGSVLERNLYLTEKLFGWQMFARPITDLLALIVVAVLAVPPLMRWLRRRGDTGAGGPGGAAARGRGSPERPVAVSRGERVLDGVWVAASAWYVWTARGYPSAAGLVPTVVGGAVLAAAVVQFLGGFLPRLRSITHGTGIADPALGPAAAGETAGVVPATAAATAAPTAPATAAPTAAPTPAPTPAPSATWPSAHGAVPSARRSAAGFLVLAGFAATVWLLGFLVAIPALMLVYLGTLERRPWPLALGAAIAMEAFAYLLFVRALGIPLPPGLLLGG